VIIFQKTKVNSMNVLRMYIIQLYL